MRVNVDAKALLDPRFKKLGNRLSITRFEAIGRCLSVWHMAYENRSAFMSAEDVDAIAELEGFATAMVAVDLAGEHGTQLRIRGVEERVVWLCEQDRKRELALEAKRGKPRATSRGTKTSQTAPTVVPGDVPGDDPRNVPLTLVPDLISLSGSDLPVPELPDPDLGAVVRADLGAAPDPALTPPPGIPTPGAGRSERVKINHDAWRYAAMKHAELGLDGSAPWNAMPVGAAMNDLVDRTREVLAMHDPPRSAEARALITRRIDVAFAEAQREGHARWFTPSRMWDAKSFWRAVEQTPDQARAPRAPPRGSPSTSPTHEPRKIKTLE